VIRTLARHGLILASGAVTALAFPPIDILPALFGMAVLAWAVRRAETVAVAAWAGWLWAFGFHVAGLYWIANALTVNGDQHLWVIPFAVAGLPAFLALFHAAGATLAKLVFQSAEKFMGVSASVSGNDSGTDSGDGSGDGSGGRRPSRTAGIASWLLLTVMLALTEWARGNILTGFPWNLPAYGWDNVPAMLQAASVVGAYGLSLLTVLAAMAPALLADRTIPRRDRAFAIVAVTAITLGVGVWGGDRLARTGTDMRPDVVVRVVQGNVPQRDKWNPSLRPGHLERYMSLSRSRTPPTRRAAALPVGARPTVVVWPETALAFLVDDDPRSYKTLAPAVPEGGSLIFGAPRLSRDGDGETFVHNSVMAVDDGGTRLWAFDKSHLVPFGEYVPFRDILPIDKIVPGARDFTPGKGPATLEIPGAPPVSPLICYEVIFPGRVITSDGPRPDWLLNLTNDAWYGMSTGPYQHLAIARVRAIEEGLPLVRAANTGVSAIIDSYGRILTNLELGRTGVIDSPLPFGLRSTIYATYGEFLFLLALVFLFGLGLLLLRGGVLKMSEE
jgi:apolipoprotein N-acyltransferase